MTNLDSILKSRDITLSTEVHLVKAMVFLVVMYGCESWTIKKAERRRSDAFELWCWRRLLRVPWAARRSKPVHPKGDQSWVFIGRTDVSAETLILWSPDAKSWLIWKDPDTGKDCGQEEKGTTEDEMVEWHHQLNGCDREAWRAAIHGVIKSRTGLSDWTELMIKLSIWFYACKIFGYFSPQNQFDLNQDNLMFLRIFQMGFTKCCCINRIYVYIPKVRALRVTIHLDESSSLLAKMCFPGGSECMESACSAGDPCSIPGLGRSPGEGNGYPLQYSCLGNPMDRGAWWATVHGVAKSCTWLNDFSFHFY